MPWGLCSHSWNTVNCSERLQHHNFSRIGDYTNNLNETTALIDNRISSADEYYHIYMLGISSSKGLHELGSIKIDLLMCLVTIFVLMYICIYRGVKSTGRQIEKKNRYISISSILHQQKARLFM